MSRITRRFTYANVTATLALLFAMSGGALAAGHYLITSTKQIKPSVLSALKGKAGASGAQGPQGAQGPAGAKGENGVAGSAGANGTNGTTGESVVVAKLAAGSECKAGGAKFSNATGHATACNGEAAAGGGYTEVLPPEKTEQGAWSFSSSEAFLTASISFPIRLSEALAEADVHYVGPKETVTACPGSVAEPKAAPGNLCVYQGAVGGVSLLEGTETANAEIFPPSASIANWFEGKETGAGKNGAFISFGRESEAVGWGSWAVTAPAAS